LVFDHIHPDFHASSRERRRILTEEKQPVPEAERVYLKMDGTPVTAETKAVPFKFRGEDAVLALARDVTKRRLAQLALRLSEERFRTAFENASVGMCLVGLTGCSARSMRRWLHDRLCAGRSGWCGHRFTHPDDFDHA
jgi:PAS domain-containing protein